LERQDNFILYIISIVSVRPGTKFKLEALSKSGFPHERTVSVQYFHVHCISPPYDLNICNKNAVQSFSPKSFVCPSNIKNLKINVYRTLILPVVLYGCETWSLTLREERRLRIFENRVLRRIFGPEREEDGSWRKLHDDELHSL
jgi:hypothetical protein